MDSVIFDKIIAALESRGFSAIVVGNNVIVTPKGEESSEIEGQVVDFLSPTSNKLRGISDLDYSSLPCFSMPLNAKQTKKELRIAKHEHNMSKIAERAIKKAQLQSRY